MRKIVTVVIPVYNAEKSIEKAVESLFPLNISCEILLIDDGSNDKSELICRRLAQEKEDVHYIKKNHGGVSDTRNYGIRHAKGKYILFLDADDELQPGSVEKLVAFFDECYELVDMVTYPIITHYYERVLEPHFRYKTLSYNGIYDLRQFPYIGQTTMNIMVKNQYGKNVLFDTSMTFSEDQKYCNDILRSKMKIGFCEDAGYIYNRSEESSSGKMKGACYIFEQSMGMFEDMFRGYEEVPLAFQGLFINDLAWKLRSNMLYPYHYSEEFFNKAIRRIERLLEKVDADVILGHPAIDFFHKYYWLSMKPNHGAKVFFKENEFGITIFGRKVFSQANVEIVVTRIREDNGTFIFRGFLKSVVFQFSSMPKLYAIVNGEEIEMDLFLSSHSYYLCHTQTNRFYAFCFEVSLDELCDLKFVMELDGCRYGCTYYFQPKLPFSYQFNRYDAIIGRRHIQYDVSNKQFVFTKKSWDVVLKKNGRTCWTVAKESRLRKKAIRLRRKQRIHLYYDCRGVKCDNGYYRFLEDYTKKDGIVRKYIIDPKLDCVRDLFSEEQRHDIIQFGSEEHKVYLLAAEKIFTAYIEDNNIFPFPLDLLGVHSDFYDFEVEYLQHGILHADIPWKYTPEFIMADKICVSTEYEERLFRDKYHFREQDIIRRIMPRLKQFDKEIVPQNKILFVPSWRQYLIGPNIDGRWQPMEDLFLHSDYYNGIMGLLNSDEMHELLEKNNYVLEMKLHPIFKEYTHLFQAESNRIHIIDEIDRLETYKVVLTDFSSFIFDFIYLGRRVYSYIPDVMQFKSGMNGYRGIEPESQKLFEGIEGIEDIEKLFHEKKVSKYSLAFFE